MTFDVEAACNSWLNQRMRDERSHRMKAMIDTAHAYFDLPDGTQLGDTFEIIGTARVVALEEELVVEVGSRVPGAEPLKPGRKATLAVDARLRA